MDSINREFVGIKGKDGCFLLIGFEVSNRKMMNLCSNNALANSGYYSRNLDSSVFLGAPRNANFNPLNLKFDKPGINNQARPQDNDILHQRPEKRGSSRMHESVDLEFKMPRNRFEKFYHSKKRTAERVAGGEHKPMKFRSTLSSSQPNLRIPLAEKDGNQPTKVESYYIGKQVKIDRPYV